MNLSIPQFVNTFQAPTQAPNENTQPAQLLGFVTSDIDRIQYAIWFLACALKAAGGTDYTSKLTGSAVGTLRRDAQNALSGYNMDMLRALESFIWYNAAVDLGGGTATVGSAVKNWTVSTSGLTDVSSQDLMRMKLLLLDNLMAKKL